MPLLLLLVWIVLEAWIIARLAEHFGGLPVFAGLVGMAVLGVWVIRRRGLSVIREIQAATARGELPAHAMIEGLVGIMGGLLLIVPGVLSDILGLSLLFGSLRRRLASKVTSGIAKARPDLRQPVTLEGEFRHREDERGIRGRPEEK